MAAAVLLPQKRIKHILCDLDGTLIYSGDFRVYLDFISKTLPNLKRHQGWRAAIRALKESQSILKIPSTLETNLERMITVFQKHLKLEREQAIEELRVSMDVIFPKLKGHFGKMEGAAEFVAWAKSNYSLTLATNPVWSIELVKLRMNWGGIDPEAFTSITTADRMHATKPSIEYYREILAQEGFDPSECLLVGNEREMDLPATQAGIGVFLVRLKATEMTCIQNPSSKSPGAWRGNYEHLRAMLKKNAAT